MSTTSRADTAPGLTAMPEAEASFPQVSMLAVLNMLLRRRLLVTALPLVVTIGVLAYALLQPRRYTASGTFMPQSSTRNVSGVSGLAAQFGITVAGEDPGQSPAFYAALLQSREILGAAVEKAYPTELDGRPVNARLAQLLHVRASSPALLHELAIRKLSDAITITTKRETGTVEMAVTLERPGLALQVADELIRLVNDFNLSKRQSQAAAERRFVEGRLADARAELRAAEDRLESFLQANREYSSAQLQLAHERLEREVTLRQQVVSSLSEAYERARIDEVRNIPVITVIEAPVLPARPDSRHLALNTLLSLFGGLALAVVLAFLLEFGRRTRELGGGEYADFAALSAAAAEDLRHPLRALFRRRAAVPELAAVNGNGVPAVAGPSAASRTPTT